MKPTTKILFLLTTTLVLSSCDKKQKKQNNKIEPVNLITTSLAQQKIEKPKTTISYEKAKELQQEYIATRAKVLNQALNKNGHFKGVTISKEKRFVEDVRDITFDLKTLKQYIAYVEQEAENKGLKGLGLRVYLGAYPKKDKESKDPGFSTVFFMPTYQKASDSNKSNKFYYWFKDIVMKDIDGLNMGQGGKPPQDLD
ncbi:hypothetical protein [Polaribacter sp.]|uniref:hypothetical protein n=1 Tax=Polaribacter sp. TaxID=1920175 RepID=UPI003EF0E9B7